MADNPAENSILNAADAAAEAQAAALRNGGQQPENHRPEVDPAREADLDDVFNEVSKTQPPASDVELGRENNGVVMPIEGQPAAETAEEVAAREEAAEVQKQKAADEAAATPKTDDTGKSKGLLDQVLAEESAKPGTQAADPYGDVKLRSDASPKTRETFEQLKTIAKQREEAAIAKATEAQTKLDELSAKVAELEKKSLAPETEAELKELREFRAQYGAEHAPEFKQKYDGRIESNYASIYERLKVHGLRDTELQKLQSFSPAERDAAIENFLDQLSGSAEGRASRRAIEAKLADNLNVSEERSKALAEIKGKAAEIVAKERSAPTEQKQQLFQETAALLKPALARLPWIHTKDIPANAPAEEKKALEAHNKFAAEVQESLKFVLTNDTPQARAESAIAVPLARHLQRENAQLTARAEAAEKKLAAIEAAGRTARTARSAASPNAAPAPSSRVADDPSDALDQVFKEVQGARR